jgi:hypothetical protein
MRGKMQVSQETANKLTIAGKGHWLTPREDAVNAKGKGVLQTYWVNLNSNRKDRSHSVASSGGTHSSDDLAFDEQVPVSEEQEDIIKRERMADWMTELLCDYLKQILAKRPADAKSRNVTMSEDLIAIDEVVEAIMLPRFDAKMQVLDQDWKDMLAMLP